MILLITIKRNLFIDRLAKISIVIKLLDNTIVKLL